MKNENAYFLEEEFHKRKKLSPKKISPKTPSYQKKSGLCKRGRVISITKENVWVQQENKTFFCTVKGSLKQTKKTTKNLICVGDWVVFEPIEKEIGQIISIEKRFSFLTRKDPLQKKQHFIAVNVDQVFITCSVALPPLKPFLVDRYIIACQKGNMSPLILINKIDLLDKERAPFYKEFIRIYTSLSIPVISVSCKTKKGLNSLKRFMRKKTSVFSGQSGVGKSSLINFTLGLCLPVGKMTVKHYRGKHTTSQAHLLPMKGGGFCIDTPGIKSLGIYQLEKEEIKEYFKEIKAFSKNCRFQNCLHFKEPSCGVKKAVEEGKISPLRFDSYQSLLAESLNNKEY